MNVQRINYQNNYNKQNLKQLNYTPLKFMGTPVKQIQNLTKESSFFERLSIWFKKKVGLYDVNHEGKYVVESFLTPHNLNASGDIVVIGMNANIKGVYKTPDYIEFFGKLASSGELHARHITFYSCAKIAGKVNADKTIHLSGKIQDSAEFNAEKIFVHPDTKVAGKLNSKEIKYLEKP